MRLTPILCFHLAMSLGTVSICCFLALLLCVSALFHYGFMATNSHRNVKGWDEELGISKTEAIGSLSLIGAPMVSYEPVC